MDSQIIQNQPFNNEIGNIARESIYLGFFESFKILLLALAAGIFIRFLYKKFSTSYSSKDDYGNTILIITISVASLIAVVKSSLALSLGLVGALSVVRFRTAVKEPINLGFLLFSICVGITIGASQILFASITLLIGSVSIIFIHIKSGVKSRNSSQKESAIDSISLIFPIEVDLDELTNILSEECEFYEIQTFEQSSENKSCNLNLRVKLKNFNSLNNLRIKIKSNFAESSIIFYNSPIY